MTYTIVPESIQGGYIGDFKDEDVVRASYCYLHGKLEAIVQYDIFSMLRSELKPNEINENWVSDEFKAGVYPCICMGNECTFFRWENGGRFSGLIVMNSDTENYKYAKNAYETKSIAI